MTKRIRRNAPDGAHCYGRGRYWHMGEDGSVYYWRGGNWVHMPGLTEYDLSIADGIIWFDGRGYRFLWVSAFVLVLGVVCMVVLR